MMHWTQIRDIALFIGGAIGVAHETLLQHAERPTLLILFAAMLGLPAFLRPQQEPPVIPPPPPPPPPRGSEGNSGEMNKVRNKLHGYSKYYFGIVVLLELLALIANHGHL